MARLDVYVVTGEGYVVDVQASLLAGFHTRVVVPLLPSGTTSTPLGQLNPIFDILGVPHVLLTQSIASIPTKELRRPVASLDKHHDAITRALDILLLGY